MLLSVGAACLRADAQVFADAGLECSASELGAVLSSGRPGESTPCVGLVACLEALGQALGNHVGHGLDGDHGVDACGCGEDGCVCHEQIADLHRI